MLLLMEINKSNNHQLISVENLKLTDNKIFLFNFVLRFTAKSFHSPLTSPEASVAGPVRLVSLENGSNSNVLLSKALGNSLNSNW